MKRKIFISGVLLLLFSSGFGQSVFTVKSGLITFFSSAPLENIEASNNSPKGMIITASSEVHFIIPIRQFKFAKKLMEEHFNENYLESHKFPTASFDGKINEQIDFTKDGTYDITSTGKLNIHGVEKEITEKGKLIISGSELRLKSEMKVALADYKIEIPKLVNQNLAEVIDVKIDILFIPYKKEEKKK